MILWLSAALAANLRPDTFEDAADPGRCSLRSAIQAANTNAPVAGCPAGSNVDVDVITLAAGTYRLDLTGDLDDTNQAGDLDVTGTLVIRGAGRDRTVVDGASIDRVFDAADGSTLTLTDLTVTGGAALGPELAPASGGSSSDVETFLFHAGGGGVRARGSLVLRRVAVRANQTGATALSLPAIPGCTPAGVYDAPGAGGGVLALGPLLIEASLIEDNVVVDTRLPTDQSVSGLGGGVAAYGGGTIDRSLVRGNRVGRHQLSLPNIGTVPGGAGGGVYTRSPTVFEVINTTIVGNEALEGGGAWGLLRLRFSTVTENDADRGGGFAGGVEADHCILAGNTATLGPDCTGALQAASVHVGAVDGCTLDPAQVTTGAVVFLPLEERGGSVPTMPPAARLEGAPTCSVAVDARGVPRPIGDGCDLGAFEAGCGDDVLEMGEACEGLATPTCDLCQPTECGDGRVNPVVEGCDDGAANSDTTPDACRTDCEPPSCGDGVADQGEDCDTAGTSATCDADCTFSVCGDGSWNEAFEVCDDGADNHDWRPDACREDCTLPTCGDGVVDAGETCDRGDENGDTANGCRADCALWTCGDGVLDRGEACDDGDANSGDLPGACRPTCVLAFCGDGVADAGEACDQGARNGDDPDACRVDCRLPSCGDGVVDAGEACDDGVFNGEFPSACRIDCVPASCGDGVLDLGEACDDGPANSNDLDATCRPDCQPPRCGDGVVEDGEDCDDGADNGEAPGACREDCATPECGDGVVDAGEDCDDGAFNARTPNACRVDCAFPTCGDGVVDFGEACDDGNGAADDGCDACAVEKGFECALGDDGSVCALVSGCGSGGRAWWLALMPLAWLRRRGSR
jgi:cysteine-rich repeat protein